MLGKELAHEFADHDLAAIDQAELDITNEAQVKEFIASQRPELIINAAAYTAVDKAETERDHAFAVNADGVKHLALAAHEHDATLVHFSTDYIFAGDNPDGYAENAVPANPVNAYGESKLAGEQALAASGARAYLIRTAWLYGDGPNFVDTMLRLAETKSELSVVDDQYGCPTYTRDLATAAKDLLANQYQPGIYHLVNEGQTTWRQFAVEIFRQAGKNVVVNPITSAEYPRPAKRPQYSILKNTKGPALRPWPEALADYLKTR